MGHAESERLCSLHDRREGLDIHVADLVVLPPHLEVYEGRGMACVHGVCRDQYGEAALCAPLYIEVKKPPVHHCHVWPQSDPAARHGEGARNGKDNRCSPVRDVEAHLVCGEWIIIVLSNLSS